MMLQRLLVTVVLSGLLAGCVRSADVEPVPVAVKADVAQDAEVVFRETFADPSLPGWNGVKPEGVSVVKAEGPDGIPALCMEAGSPASATRSVSLPVERIAGKAVTLDVWRKADGVKTGSKHYLNAKTMLSWKAASEAKPKYSSTGYSDFYGTFDWERHRYVMEMPKDLEWATVTIGLQSCCGKAFWAGLAVTVDPRFPSQEALRKYLVAEERQAYEKLDADTLSVRRLNGGIVQVYTGMRYVPRQFWNEAAREVMLKVSKSPAKGAPSGTCNFRTALTTALASRAAELESGFSGLQGGALNDRTYEVASLRERVRQLGAGAGGQTTFTFRPDGKGDASVSELVFGNNINTQNLSAPYDPERGTFQDGLLERIRPMGITFLRYPGGCNADVFNWKDTVGPLDQRKDLINYHNGTSRGAPKFGVDEYLRFCEQEGMEPLITTAFCKDLPHKVDPNDHPKGIRHKFVFDYLKSAPERVKLAADWVEYCNGSVDTPMGKLRARNGHPAPYKVTYWEVGNESYGPDPTGSCSPEEYAAAFPRYVEAMKARDPSIRIVMNGCGHSEWDETVIRLAGKHADAYQFHIYLTPRVHGYSKLEGRPHQASDGMRLGDSVPTRLKAITDMMDKHLGRRLPIIISEYGMGNARNREFMTSVTSAVLVADMWRGLIESPDVLGANKWCLYTGYWFSQIQGPTTKSPDAPYYIRPEHVAHEIYARCRGTTRLSVNNADSDAAKAVVFKRPDTYGVVLISREAVDWQSVILDLPGVRKGKATCILVTAGHPFLGNEKDHSLIGKYEFSFDVEPGKPIILPANSVMGLIVTRD